MEPSWQGEPRFLTAGRIPPRGEQPGGIARAWQELTGDAGWAGVLAESFLADPHRPAFLIFEPGMELLPLFAEALALLPAESRWDVDFSTYFTKLPQGLDLRLAGRAGRIAGSEAGPERARRPGARPGQETARRQRRSAGRVCENRHKARPRQRAFRLGPRADLLSQGKPATANVEPSTDLARPKTGSPARDTT